MTSFAHYLASALADFTYSNVPYPSPPSVWQSLYIDDPTDDDTGSELSVVDGYGRQQISFGSPALRSISNTAPTVFGPVTGSDWGVANFSGIHDAETGGNLLCHAPLDAPIAAAIGEDKTFPVGNINVELKKGISDYWSHKLLSHVFLNIPAVSPTTTYLALCDGDPTNADVDTEITGNALTRMAMSWSAAVLGVVDVDAQIDFPAGTPSGQGTASSFMVRDAITGGNLLTFGPWVGPEVLGLNQFAQLIVGNLRHRFT